MGKIYYNGVDYSAPVISGVSGIKGNAESTYRTGNVNITPANIGLGNVNNTADSDKSVKHATTANNASYTNYINNVDDVDGHEIEIGYKAPVTDYTKLNYIAGFTSDSDELILRPIDSSVVAGELPVARTDEVVSGTITFGNSDDYGIRTNADNYGRIGDSSKQFYEVHAKSIYENKTLLSNKYAVKSHASTSSSTYGCGTANNWGHVKLSDSYTSSSGAASSGVAASSKALYDAYTTLNAKFKVKILEDAIVDSNGTVTLNDNVKNYNVIEVYFIDNDNMYGITRFGAGNGAFRMISMNYLPSNNTFYIKYTQYEAKENHLYFSSSYEWQSNGNVSNGTYHRIYRVVGYKY